MSVFGVYMAKYYDMRQHQFRHLSHLCEVAWALYKKVQVESWVFVLEKELEKAHI